MILGPDWSKIRFVIRGGKHFTARIHYGLLHADELRADEQLKPMSSEAITFCERLFTSRLHFRVLKVNREREHRLRRLFYAFLDEAAGGVARLNGVSEADVRLPRERLFIETIETIDAALPDDQPLAVHMFLNSLTGQLDLTDPKAAYVEARAATSYMETFYKNLCEIDAIIYSGWWPVKAPAPGEPDFIGPLPGGCKLRKPGIWSLRPGLVQPGQKAKLRITKYGTDIKTLDLYPEQLALIFQHEFGLGDPFDTGDSVDKRLREQAGKRLARARGRANQGDCEFPPRVLPTDKTDKRIQLLSDQDISDIGDYIVKTCRGIDKEKAAAKNGAPRSAKPQQRSVGLARQRRRR